MLAAMAVTCAVAAAVALVVVKNPEPSWGNRGQYAEVRWSVSGGLVR
jgi:hypothetical protein